MIASGKTGPKQDSQDKHGSHSGRYSEEAVVGVHEHIKSIPHYHLHYSTAQNLNGTCYDLELSVSTLCSDYYLSWYKVSHSSACTLQVNRIEEMGDMYLLTWCYKPPKLK
jgi:hypothetical protein